MADFGDLVRSGLDMQAAMQDRVARAKQRNNELEWTRFYMRHLIHAAYLRAVLRQLAPDHPYFGPETVPLFRDVAYKVYDDTKDPEAVFAAGEKLPLPDYVLKSPREDELRAQVEHLTAQLHEERRKSADAELKYGRAVADVAKHLAVEHAARKALSDVAPDHPLVQKAELRGQLAQDCWEYFLSPEGGKDWTRLRAYAADYLRAKGLNPSDRRAQYEELFGEGQSDDDTHHDDGSDDLHQDRHGHAGDDDAGDQAVRRTSR